MAGYRDDSAGGYGVWNDSELSWLDYLKAKGSDIGGGAYNALSNITGALSPIGTSGDYIRNVLLLFDSTESTKPVNGVEVQYGHAAESLHVAEHIKSRTYPTAVQESPYGEAAA